MLRNRFLAAVAVVGLVFVVIVIVKVLDPADRGRPVDPDSRIVVTPLALVSRPVAAPPQQPVTGAEPVSDHLGDQVIRAMAAELSAHPVLMEWLLRDRLIDRFAEAVEMVASGISPCDQLDFLRPSEPFLVQRRDGRLVIAPGSYRRYDLATEVFVSLDTAGAVDLLRRLEPALTAAHREVAWGDARFEDRLVEAMDHLLAVAVPGQSVTVEARALTYAFADPGLEGLSDAQRHLLRMGPVNARRVQDKLRQLRAALRPGLPSPPPGRAGEVAVAAVDVDDTAPWRPASPSPGAAVEGLEPGLGTPP